MEPKRKSDPASRPVFRTDRVIKEGDMWYFTTREGTIEGPYRDKIACLNQLELYIKVMLSGMLPEQEQYEFLEASC